jgi:sulfide:quinone oxidoreductase
MSASTGHRLVIVGGGAAGITVAAELRRDARGRALDITLVEPAETHHYQPAFTLVGAGVCSLESTRRQQASLIPAGVRWVRDRAASFAPHESSLTLASGETLGYDTLVVCTGLSLNWDSVKGLREALGKGGVCSNYSPETVRYTWECLQGLQRGARVLCTQPPMPFKCPGAPQKIAYLAADWLRRKGLRGGSEVRFLTHAPAIFGVPFYAKELVKIAAGHGIDVRYQHNLVEVDAAARQATFEIVGGETQGQRVTLDYDMLHVSPAQHTPEAVRGSPLANAAGFVDVHPNTLQHTQHANVFALGDCCSTANSKTAAAVRKQAPVVVRNLLHRLHGEALEEGYDGYASCPLTTAYGKVLMAEFIYGGKPTPTLPLDPAQERWVNWWIKKTGLPLFYWDYMLKGHVSFPGHNTNFQVPSG